MVFSSITFIFLFLPIVLAVYHILRKELQNLFLLIASLIFYFWGEQWLVWIVLVSTGVNYLCGLLIGGGGLFKGEPVCLEKGGKRSRFQKICLCFSIFTNFGFLGYFKYSNFFADNICSLFAVAGLPTAFLAEFSEIALPLGISFYTFQSMSYTIDVYRGDVKASRNFIDFACYVAMFPQLVAGPIVRYRDIEVQLAVIRALGKIGGTEAKNCLEQCLDDLNEVIQLAAEQSLRDLNEGEEPLAFSL